MSRACARPGSASIMATMADTMRSTGARRGRTTGRPRLAVLALSAGVAAVLHGQERPTFRSGQDVLTIQVSVRRADGSRVTDLREADFHVRIDGADRRVLSARRYGPEPGRLTNDAEPVPRFARVTDAP